jgi:phosphatidylinositol glycan class S
MAQSVQDEATASTLLENIVDGALGEDIAPLDAASAALKKREAPPERPESVALRRLVIFSFWAIVLFLGLPIWWRTTAIYRAKLPLSQMMDWAEGRVRWQLCFITY